MIHLQSLISHWHRLNSNILGVFRFPTVFPYRNQWDVCPTGILRAVLRLHFLQKLQQTLAHGSIGLHIPWSNWWFLQEDVWNFCGISAFQMINFMVPWCSMVISWLGSHGFYDPAIPISRPEKKTRLFPQIRVTSRGSWKEMPVWVCQNWGCPKNKTSKREKW